MLTATFTLAGVCRAAARARGSLGAPDCGGPQRATRGERGFTMPELLIAMVMAVVVLTAALVLLQSGQQAQARDAEWALTLQQDRAGVARMMRDIRQATEIIEPSTGAAASYIAFWATIGGKKWKVKYECNVAQSGTTYTECMRLAAEEGQVMPSKGPRVATDVLNGSAVFSYLPSGSRTEAKLVTAKVELPAKGTLKQAGSVGYGHNVVLEDAALVRNLCLSC
jgi:prepilin-type N-terminal cleavage/methylation domain-containing protein